MATSHRSEKPNQLTEPSRVIGTEHCSLPGEAVADDTKSQWIVQFEDGDPSNPKNFKTLWKAFLTFQMGLLALTGSMGSSIMAPAQSKIATDMHIAQEATTLTVALFVLGW